MNWFILKSRTTVIWVELDKYVGNAKMMGKVIADERKS
jgi:hypothetical protein